MTEKRQILKSASLITAATLVSRICGYLRDQRITLLLGTSTAADSFILAFRIPNLIRRLAADGSVTAAFIPVFARTLRERPKEELWRFARQLFWILVLALGLVTILGMIFSPAAIYAFTLFGYIHAQWALAVYLNRIIFPYVFFIGLTALAAAILNSFQIFGLPASTPILFNLSVILFSLGVVYRPVMKWAPPQYRSPAVALAAGILLGGVLQFLAQVPSLVKRGMKFNFGVSLSDPLVRRVGRLLVPGFVGIGMYQISFFVDTIFATSSRMPQGSVTSLYVADRVMELALGSYAIAFSTALLPTMSHQAATGRFEDMKKTFAFSLRVVSFITVPAAVGLILLRGPIIQVLFQHGRFVAESTVLTARALFYYSLGLPAFAAVKLIVPMFYSIHDTRTPVQVATAALALNIALNSVLLLFFFRVFSNGSPALATSLSAYLNFFALFFIFRKRFGRLGARATMRSLAKVAACSVAMGLGCYGLLRYSGFETHVHFLARLGLLAGMILSAMIIYAFVAWALRCEEIGEVLSMLRRPEGFEPSLPGNTG